MKNLCQKLFAFKKLPPDTDVEFLSEIEARQIWLSILDILSPSSFRCQQAWLTNDRTQWTCHVNRRDPLDVCQRAPRLDSLNGKGASATIVHVALPAKEVLMDRR
jgi:hypothetical protein